MGSWVTIAELATEKHTCLICPKGTNQAGTMGLTESHFFQCLDDFVADKM